MLFSDSEALVRTIVVGLLAYAGLVVLLRVSGKRTLSKWNAFDFIVTIALGSSLATALLSRQTTLAQGLLAFALLIVLQLIVTWVAVRSGRFERWIKAQPQVLLCRGKLMHEAMRAERVSQEELCAAVRSRGFSALEQVELVVLETDGTFSVITHCQGSKSALHGVRGASGMLD